MNRPLAALGAVAGAALALAGLQVAVPGGAHANPAGTGLVISEVNPLAGTYDATYVELYNPTNAPIDLTGMSLQSLRANGTVAGTLSLAGTVPAQHTFLVQTGATGTTGLPLPTPDQVASPTLQLISNGALILGTGTTYPTGNLAGAAGAAAGVIDMVGIFQSPSYETAAGPSDTAGNSASLTRDDADADTDDNATDFTWAGPSPVNSTGSQARLTPTVTTSDVSAVAGQGATVPVTVTGGGTTPTGYLQILDGDAVLGSYAKLNTDGWANGGAPGSFAPGTYTLTAWYGGDANYTPASTTFTLTVTAGSTPSTVTAANTTAATGAAVSEPVTVSSTAAGGTTPTGTLTFWKGSADITNGVIYTLDATGSATIRIDPDDLTPGVNVITVKYTGDATYAASSTTFTITTPTPPPAKVASTTTVSAPAATYGNPAHVTVTVRGGTTTATGSVTLSGAGAAQTRTLAGGRATFTLPKTLPVGSHTLTASYHGSTRLNTSSHRQAIRINKRAANKPTVKITTKPTRKRTGKATVTVSHPSGLATPTGKVKVTLKLGKTTKTVTASLRSGKATVKLPKLPKKGRWSVSARYLGNGTYTAKTSSTLSIKVS